MTDNVRIVRLTFTRNLALINFF